MKKQLSFILLILITIMIAACGGTAAPLIDREQAIKEIEKAESVDAAIHSANQYNQAKLSFDNGENLIDTKAKSENNAKAKSEYKDAINIATDAYNRSLYPYILGYIKETQNVINAAARSPQYERKTIENANKLNKEARADLEASKFNDAKVKSTQARTFFDKMEDLAEITVINSDDSMMGSDNFIYHVIHGDNLWNIAKDNLNDPLRWKDIYQLNKDQIEDPDLIYPEQKFKIQK